MQVKNISKGARGIWTTGGLVTLEPGEVRDLEVAKGEEAGEWFEFGDSEDAGLAGMKVPELKALAEAEGIDLGEASKKADIVAAIEKARADAA